jgi:hypothetical protein
MPVGWEATDTVGTIIRSTLTKNRYVRPGTLTSLTSGLMTLPWPGRLEDVRRVVQHGLDEYPRRG